MSNYNLIHNNTNRRHIATITFSDNNEATVTSKQIPVDILLYVGEGPIPHFHIVSKDKSFDCCICIFDNYYFSHGGMYQSVLNTEQRKLLNDFLSSPNHDSPYATNWQCIRYLWIAFNRGTDGRKEHYPIDQPDYTNIRPFTEYKTKKKSEKAYIKRLYKR
jgi:hypothetical protein